MTSSNVALVDRSAVVGESNQDDYITMTISGHLFGLPVLVVQDVLGHQRITNIPLAPREVAGALNLRGRIVTAIDLRECLGLAPTEEDREGMSIVVEHRGELYSFVVDAVGEVLSLQKDAIEPSPSTMDPQWLAVSWGISTLKDQLLVLLDVDSVLDLRDSGRR